MSVHTLMDSYLDMQHPRIAIIDPNTLASLGLRSLLQTVMPMMRIDVFGSFAELEANGPDSYFHYFADMRIVLSHMAFFVERRVKTIVLSGAMDTEGSALGAFHTICVNQPEKALLRSLLMLEQHAHAHGRNLPPMEPPHGRGGHKRNYEAATDADGSPHAALSAREIEVMSLVARGHINKQIAGELNISVPTVVTHRKNVMAKLGMHSVSALTIYAVMHGYVDVNDI